MSNVEMYPSSAVAQSHLPGSTAPSLQQPPPSSTASNFHSHHRTSAIFQNPSFDNKHSTFRSSEVSVNVNKVNNQTSDEGKVEQYHSQPAFAQACTDSTVVMTKTSTATDSAMMVDEMGVKAEARSEAHDTHVTEKDNAKGESKGVDVKQQTEGSTEPNVDNGSNASVRKVR
ncbi:hypothetical protein PHSY_006323 [Pseudozyma hubeiensis SY62]|uniref:Uncharacterized protein n=1 Tax=Pseudozyma hubeiensis (strain SY62) TaxID=1305764 RepID=R9PBK8_PSEHS|nr:hypothetical protein PHSY_006323 [Pseudozyma hubeiensis SY62]GAC98729.1 hypothetical protein PHSY_006323 [Pseudozyma hubeiensis SY62]